MMVEIHAFSLVGSSVPLGVVLVSRCTECHKCSGKLVIRGDRASRLVVYTEKFGTVIGTHYHKYCNQLRCNYGYHKFGDHSVVYYDSDWAKLEYFVSTSETAIEMRILQKFNAELATSVTSKKLISVTIKITTTHALKFVQLWIAAPQLRSKYIRTCNLGNVHINYDYWTCINTYRSKQSTPVDVMSPMKLV